MANELLFSKRELYPTYETWLEAGKEAAKQSEEVAETLKSSRKRLGDWRWVIGDWLLDGEKLFDKRVSYAEVGQTTRLDSDELYICRYVAKRFPNRVRSKHPKVSWNHHKEIAKIKGEDLRQQWLKRAENLSVVNLRREINKNKSLQRRVGTVSQRQGNATVTLHFHARDFEILKRLAKLNREGVEEWLQGILLDTLRRSFATFKPEMKKVLDELDDEMAARRGEEERNQNEGIDFDDELAVEDKYAHQFRRQVTQMIAKM